MFSRSLYRTASAQTRNTLQAPIRTTRKTTTSVRCASLFTASIGLGACPKRRRKQSNEESGEDAYFINTTSGSKVWAGVFDGVGGWADMGVDPSIFSAGLAKHCDSACDAVGSTTAVEVLVAGYHAVQKDANIKLGSSTACVASLDLNRGELQVANLGDSGYLIVDTAGTVVFASKPQTYFFNAPYQLAKMPASIRQPGSLENRPEDADFRTHQLKTNEIVILATDGFFDNVFSKDAAKVVVEQLHSGNNQTQIVESIAHQLTELAKKNGRGRVNGPFAEEAKAHRLRYDGGKEDDICVIVIGLEGNLKETSKL